MVRQQATARQERSRLRRVIIWATGTVLVVGLAIGYQATVPVGEHKVGQENSTVHDEQPGTGKLGESK